MTIISDKIGKTHDKPDAELTKENKINSFFEKKANDMKIFLAANPVPKELLKGAAKNT